jgi:hypothetical protein
MNISSRTMRKSICLVPVLALFGLHCQSLTISPVSVSVSVSRCNAGHRLRRSNFSLHSTETTEDYSRETTTNPEKKPIDRIQLSKLDSCRTRTAANRIISQALATSRSERDCLYDSIKIPQNVSTRPISDAELSLQTRTINSKYKIFDLLEQNGDRDIDRASLAVFCVFMFGSTSAILAQQTTQGLPEIVRWLIVFALCFSPLVLVGYGLAVPEQLSAVLVSIQRALFPSYRKRMIQHEAGHFLLGYLLGWPVKTYRANNAVKSAVEFFPLSDVDAGKERAQQLGFDARNIDSDSAENEVAMNGESDRPYYSKEGKGNNDMERSVLRDSISSDASYFALPRIDDPTSSWPYRGFDDATLDKLAIISVAGACAEILSYGNAEGGVADLIQLRRIYGAAASASRNSSVNGVDGQSDALGSFSDDAKDRRLRREEKQIDGTMGEKEMDNRTRFALGYAMGLLRQHLGALDALAEVMERDGSVGECIVALEECPNVSGYTLKGDYDKIRREKFRAEERGLGAWIERTFLGGSKTIDIEDVDVIEGKGGGERRQGFQLTGDDPLYVALAVAVVFFAWASEGGLSLH